MLKVIVLILFGVMCGKHNAQDYVYNELPCLLAKGECTKSADCPDGVKSLIGFCPRQEQNGIQCCLSRTSSCKSHGGECFPTSYKCPHSLIRDAKDCSQEERCCILVK